MPTNDPPPLEMTWTGELGRVGYYVAVCKGRPGHDAHFFQWVYIERGPASENRDASSNYSTLLTSLPGGRELPKKVRAMLFEELERANRQGREAG